MRCKYFLSVFFLVLFLLLQSVFLPGQSNEKADITKAELMIILEENSDLKESSKKQETNFQTILNQLEADHQNDLTMLEMKYDQKIKLLEIESDLRTASLTTLKKEMIWNNVKWFIAGLGFGFGTGNYTGIKIGITL